MTMRSCRNGVWACLAAARVAGCASPRPAAGEQACCAPLARIIFAAKAKAH
jgi:hypothetical protein